MLKLSSILAISLAALWLPMGETKDWWENGNFYQIYPRSFKDSDGDGIGDLRGVAEKLQYLADIGMDGVWLSPIFKSPMADFGYDISDFYQVHPEYGTMEDFENMMKRAQEVGVKIILDFVPNHTSDENEWFVKSVNGDPDYRNFYVWNDGKINATTGEREPPSNWLSAFRYSAWEWNEVRQQYYLHQFAVKQPDLNYRDPAVVIEMKNVMRFWLSKGVSGFRIDAVPYLFEKMDGENSFPDEPVITSAKCPDPDDFCSLKHIYTIDQPETYDMDYQWRELVDEFKREHGGDTRILMAEAYTSFDNILRFYGDGHRNGTHIPFNFDFMQNVFNTSKAADFVGHINKWLQAMPRDVYANWVLGNHDNRRVASRYGVQRIDLMNILLQTLPGIAVTYNGEEFGMEDVYLSWKDTVDPQACNTDPDSFDNYSRDPARTPFRWDGSKNAGFSSGNRTWLPVGDGYEQNNVAVQLAAPDSHLKIFKRLLRLRKQEPAFQEGDFQPKVVDNVIVYKRQASTGDPFIVVLNYGGSEKIIDLTSLYKCIGKQVEVALISLQSNQLNGKILNAGSFEIDPYVGAILRVIN